MSANTNTTKPKFNVSALKTNIIVAFAFTVLGLIGGYYTTINVRTDARADVVSDMQVVAPVAALKAQK